MTFVFDIDDTISDTDGYSEKYIEQFFIEHKVPYQKTNQNTRFAEGKFDWTEKQAMYWYKVYGDEMALEFPCIKGAKELINKLYDQGHRIVIATARETVWHNTPILVTKLWLQKNKIKYSKLYTGRVDKEQICEDENADFFMDDDLKITANVASHFAEKRKKIHSLLATTSFNKDKTPAQGVLRIESYSHLEKFFKNLGILSSEENQMIK